MSNVFEDIHKLEETLASRNIDNFNVPRRRHNSRKATMGTDMFYDAKPEAIEAYKTKLEGKLNEYAKVTNTNIKDGKVI